MKDREVLVFKDIKEIAGFLQKRWSEIAKDSIEKRNRFVIALSGGNTPIKVYQELVRSDKRFPWNKAHVFLVDERFVPFNDPESNYRMIKENLLKELDIPPGNIHPIYIKDTSLSTALEYAESINRFFQLGEGDLPVFDLIMLGIGGDGHTASLFPGHEALHEKKRLTHAVNKDGLKNERITITLPVINNTREIIFLATGKDKAGIVKEVIEGESADLPASIVQPKNGKMTFVLDKDASLLLKGERS
tara:strand:+ start:273 stop:1013 length:741 start_codon:yes stop_codon:yes gene_type:complete